MEVVEFKYGIHTIDVVITYFNENTKVDTLFLRVFTFSTPPTLVPFANSFRIYLSQVSLVIHVIP